MSKTRSATAILAEIRDGQLIVEASDHIKQAMAAVRDVGKAAEVTISLTIKPYKAGSEKLIDPPLIFIGEVSSKLPKPDVEATLMFMDSDGNANRNPSRPQDELPLRDVSGGSSNS